MPASVKMGGTAAVMAALKRVEAVGRGGSPMMRSVGGFALDESRDSFKTLSSPYGDVWPELKYRKGRALDLSGDLKKAGRVRPRGSVITVIYDLVYARVHNRGYKAIPQRQYLMTAEQGFTPRVTSAIEREYALLTKKAWG